MSVLVLAESSQGLLKKAAYEVVHFGYLTAQSLGGDCIALVIGAVTDAGQLGQYGATKVVHIPNYSGGVDSAAYTKMIAAVAQQVEAHTIIVSHNSTGKSIAGRIAVRMDAGLVSQINEVPRASDDGITVGRPVFSGKAYAQCAITGSRRVLSLMGNAIPPQMVGSDCTVEEISIDIPDATVVIKDTKTIEGIIPLPEAELVVSAGRGMKGPENWNIIEELASEIGATTACSRPVADTGWRPHHEHVGQTGVAIRPNLYIAIGISGAIQHLAGVNSSKCIVVINKDPEAPFFKAADYGVCADLFDVVPRLTAAFQKYKAQ